MRREAGAARRKLLSAEIANLVPLAERRVYRRPVAPPTGDSSQQRPAAFWSNQSRLANATDKLVVMPLQFAPITFLAWPAFGLRAFFHSQPPAMSKRDQACRTAVRSPILCLQVESLSVRICRCEPLRLFLPTFATARSAVGTNQGSTDDESSSPDSAVLRLSCDCDLELIERNSMFRRRR